MKTSLSDILVEEHLIARERLAQANRVADRRGSPLATILLEQGLVTEDSLVEALCRRTHLELFDPVHTLVDLDAVREVPLEEANRFSLLPIQLLLHGGQRVLRIAMVDPLDTQAIEDIEYSTGSRVDPIIARHSHLADAIKHHYRSVATKIIQRNRFAEAAPKEHQSSRRADRQVYGEGMDDSMLHTKPIDRVSPGPQSVEVEALVRLLVRKGLISQEEYDEEMKK